MGRREVWRARPQGLALGPHSSSTQFASVSDPAAFSLLRRFQLQVVSDPVPARKPEQLKAWQPKEDGGNGKVRGLGSCSGCGA